MSLETIRLDAYEPRALVWDGDALLNRAGGAIYRLDGSTDHVGRRYSYAFDAVTTLPGSDLSVVYSRLHTKGLVIRGSEEVREINRSYYQADAYEYPVALGRLPTGREVLVHCPEAYNRLEIEDLVTGERLTTGAQRQPCDFFHSRLAVSPDGQWLLSAGWVWQPFDRIEVFDLVKAMTDPAHLDENGIGIDAWSEHSSATFLPDGHLAMWLVGDIDGEDTAVQSGALRIVDPAQPVDATVVSPVDALGTILAVDNDHVLALHGHPRLIELKSGAVVRSWPEVRSGLQMSSILPRNEPPPCFALDAINRRCAIAEDTGITVIRW